MVQILKAFKLVTLRWGTLYFKSYRVTSIANKTTLYVGIAIQAASHKDIPNGPRVSPTE